MSILRCPTCNQAPRRSLPQNNRLHLLFDAISRQVVADDKLLHHAMWWKIVMKDRWLGYNETVASNGKVIYSLRGTADLTVEELNNFMERVERYAAEHGIWLQD
jgi:NinB protein